jgi:uncharacterized protein YbjT (DUF2867 family)
MRIAVTTPTGHVGSAIVDFLLDFGGDIHVVLLGRRPERLKEFIRRGAEMSIGPQDDANYLSQATRGVDALFWATPPGYGSDDVRAFQNRLARAGAAAIRANKIPRVVNLSSIGAHLDMGVGPIGGLHDVEMLLNDAATHITHLRPGFFFENLLWQIEPIQKQGRISLPLSGQRRYPMIATRDIGRVAAARLSSQGWIGHFANELHGPVDLCFDEVAEILSQTLERKIEFVRCTPEEARQSLLDNAVSENAADLLLEMYEAVETEKLRPIEIRSSRTTTPTTLDEFAHEVMLPMLTEPATTTR